MLIILLVGRIVFFQIIPFICKRGVMCEASRDPPCSKPRRITINTFEKHGRTPGKLFTNDQEKSNKEDMVDENANVQVKEEAAAVGRTLSEANPWAFEVAAAKDLTEVETRERAKTKLQKLVEFRPCVRG